LTTVTSILPIESVDSGDGAERVALLAVGGKRPVVCGRTGASGGRTGSVAAGVRDRGVLGAETAPLRAAAVACA